MKTTEDSSGLGTYRGLNLLHLETGDITSINEGLSDPIILSILVDHTGTPWVGTDVGGLNQYENDTGRFITHTMEPSRKGSISGNRIWCIYEDTQNRLWIGTGHGLNFYHRESARFSVYGNAEGLPDNVVKGILEDDRGYIWLTTNRGVSRMDPERGTFRNFNTNDGLQSNVFNPNSGCRLANGSVLVGSNKGTDWFDPEAIEPGDYRPPIVLLSVRKSGRPMFLESEPHLLENIEFTHRDKVISFEFTALDYSNPRANRFAYKLEGFDPDWIESGNERLATYTNLDGGRYVFKVKGSNIDGLWNEDGVSLAVRIIPAPWQTWWARLLYLTVVSALILYLVRSRMARHAEELERTRREVAREHEVAERLKLMNEGLQKEIRERQRAETVQSVLYRISELTVSMTDINDFYNKLHEILGKLVPVENFFIALFEQDQQTIQYPYWVDTQNPKPPRRKFAYGLEEYILRSRKALLAYREELEQLRDRKEILPDRPLPESWLGVPLVCGDQISGVLAVQSYPGHEVFHESDKELLAFVSQHVGTALQRIQAREEIKLAQEKAVANAEARGKAEFASSVLHNIGNVLNSIKTSCDHAQTILDASKLRNLHKALTMIETHLDDLGEFFTEDPKGKVLPRYLIQIEKVLEQEQSAFRSEIEDLNNRIFLIKDLVETQQSLAKGCDPGENIDISDVINQALLIQANTLKRFQVQVKKEFRFSGHFRIEKSKTLHILINLIKNAAESMADKPPEKRVLTVSTANDERLTIAIQDQGTGIDPEHLQQLFRHGFTTKKDGHGFGLPYCRRIMTEMGGEITAASAGPGMGSTFTLRFPPVPQKRDAPAVQRQGVKAERMVEDCNSPQPPVVSG